jgi:hypothetical protein
MKARRQLAGIPLAIVLISTAPTGSVAHAGTDLPLASTSQRARFIAVNLGDDETRLADEELVQNLNNMTDTVHFSLELASYESVVETLARWTDDELFMARLTPYVYLAAVSLGADLTPIATYHSKATRATTYHSYLVVRRSDFNEKPTPEAVIQHIKERNAEGEVVRFRYHNRFSTSSYYLPSRFFLENNVFSMDRVHRSLTAIEARNETDSSSELVRMVARGGDKSVANAADLAAVWDGTKNKMCGPSADPEDREICDGLYFVQLPTTLPNDLLVASASMSVWSRKEVETAIRMMGDLKQGGDVKRWEDLRQSSEARAARSALADLVRKSRQGQARVTIDVQADPESEPPVKAWQKKAVEEAIELSGTEFTLWKPQVHLKADFEWKLRLTHDGAAEIVREPRGFLNSEEARQRHVMSFIDKVDLIDRTTDFIATRMHRIRYVWPYWEKPTVIRDLPFALPKRGTRLKISRIEWESFDRNGYISDPSGYFESTVSYSDFYKLYLSEDEFPHRRDGMLELDPMSNVWYRVLLVREQQESGVLRALTYAFVGLLILAALGTLIDLWRPEWLLIWRRAAAEPKGTRTRPLARGPAHAQ